MKKYFVVQGGAPLDTLLRSDYAKAVERAEMWAEHLRKDVSVLSVTDGEVKLEHIAFYSPSKKNCID